MALETQGANQMIITWGDDLLDTTQGLDILGVRGIDQGVELGLVNGITTISQRARYFSILPWALGEYLVDHASEGFDWDSLTVYLRRVEFVTLAASRLDSELNGADASGALGANLHQEICQSRSKKGPVAGGILGHFSGSRLRLGARAHHIADACPDALAAGQFWFLLEVGFIQALRFRLWFSR